MASWLHERPLKKITILVESGNGNPCFLVEGLEVFGLPSGGSSCLRQWLQKTLKSGTEQTRFIPVTLLVLSASEGHTQLLSSVMVHLTHLSVAHSR